MSKSMRFLMLTVLLISILLSACTSKADAPAKSVEAFWRAMAATDGAALSSLSCADYEEEALLTMESFQSVELELKDLQCSTTGTSGDSAEVTCQGTLNASYGAENFSFDLSDATFAAVKQGGDWLMCGEK